MFRFLARVLGFLLMAWLLRPESEAEPVRRKVRT